MKERGILFTGDMVRAILAGRKTVTRRLMKPQPFSNGIVYSRELGDILCHNDHLPPSAMLWKRGSKRDPWYSSNVEDDWSEMSPYGVPGDRLWVRETWHPCDGPYLFAADYESKEAAGVQRWYPGIHLRRVDARIVLDVTSVRAERLHDITEDDAKAEGVTIMGGEDCWSGSHLLAFEYLWGEINGWEGQPGARAPWPTNPWVWRVEFKRVDAARGVAA